MQPQLNSLVKRFNKEQYKRYIELLPNFKKEKAQKFTTVILTIIAVIILAIFAINPTLSTIANLQKQLDDAKFVSEKLDQKINNLSVLQTKYETLKPDLPIIYSALPKTADVPVLVGQLQTLAKNNNLSIVAISALNLVDEQDFSYFKFNITLQGEYSDIINFLDSAVLMQRIIDIEGINISSVSEANNTALSLSLQGVAFYKK